jgi:hypothetical protein
MVQVVDDRENVVVVAVVVADEAGDVLLGPVGKVDPGLQAESHRRIPSSWVWKEGVGQLRGQLVGFERLAEHIGGLFDRGCCGSGLP